MGDMADYYLEQSMVDCMFEDNEPYEFPYGSHFRKPSHRELVELAKQAAHDGNIVERAMRAMTLEQVLRIKNDNT